MAWAATDVLGTRDALPVGPQPLPVSHCCAVMTQSPHMLLRDVSTPVPGGKRPLEASLYAPQKVQTGSAAVWRPPRSGDHEGDRRPSVRDRAVRVYVRPRPRRRRGAQALCNSTFTQPVAVGGCRVRHAHRPALRGHMSPAGLRSLLLVFCWNFRAV